MTTTHAMRIAKTGGPEAMAWVEIALPKLGANDVLVQHEAVGFNFIDVVQRSGVAPVPLPTGLGHEAVGVVEAVGHAVDSVAVGDRVAYIGAGPGAYSLRRVVPEERLAGVTTDLDPQALAAVLFKGLTAQYLLRRTANIGPDDTILVHAAAGGVGSILSHWGKALGATVIGTAGSTEKCRLAEDNGCDFAVNYSEPGWVEAILARTGGKKPNVVYDSVGQATFLQSLDLAARFGMVVVFGMASGPAPAIDPELLNRKGCLFLTRPSVFAHNDTAAMFRKNLNDLLEAVAAGFVDASVGRRYQLKDAAEAHRDAERRVLPPGAILVP